MCLSFPVRWACSPFPAAGDGTMPGISGVPTFTPLPPPVGLAARLLWAPPCPTSSQGCGVLRAGIENLKLTLEWGAFLQP